MIDQLVQNSFSIVLKNWKLKINAPSVNTKDIEKDIWNF